MQENPQAQAGLEGQVCLSLAENKRHAERPFAFIATYTTASPETGRATHVPIARALQEQAKAGEGNGVGTIWGPMQRAASRSGLLAELIESRRIFQPLAWTAAEALRFLRDIAVFEESGLVVRVPDWWSLSKPPRVKVEVNVGSKAPSGVGLGAMLDFDMRLNLLGETLSADEWKRLLATADGLVLIRGRWVEVDQERLQGLLDYWGAAQELAQREGLTFALAMRLMVRANSGIKHKLLEVEAGAPGAADWSDVVAGPWLQEALAGLRDPQSLAQLETIAGLQATLRPYQHAGVKWLWHLYRLGLGGCLADDMGLGKTIQVLALLLLIKSEGQALTHPSLLVLPASLLGNWLAEAQRFAPALRILLVHPSFGRRELMAQEVPEGLDTYDLVMTSYGSLSRAAWLKAYKWNLVILDEAQAIKNPSTQQTQTVKALQSRRRLALTGTPVENRLQDLWSIFDFVNPGLLGSAAQFGAVTREASGDEGAKVYGTLRALVAPYILRRLKTDRSIISDLPDKTEFDVICSLTPAQAALYERTVIGLKQELAQVEGDKQRRGIVLSYLMRFKQICNHPSHYSGDGVYRPEESGKLRRLKPLLEEIAAKREKLLIFTQYSEISTMLAEFLAKFYGRSGLILTGATPVAQRKTLVEQFQDADGPPFFVLSLRAGGTGLTLTAASQVIHFDRWWNPAVENQATDRAFRIGQKRPVMVHKLICAGTIEERIDQMIKDKKRVAGEILSGEAEVDITSLSDEEIFDLVALDLGKATGLGEDS